MVGVRQARLEIAEDLAEESRREESRPEGAGCILADGRQQPESHSDLRGHVIKLPADLLAHSVCSVRRGETSGLRGICGGTKGMGAHEGWLRLVRPPERPLSAGSAYIDPSSREPQYGRSLGNGDRTDVP